MTCALNKYLCYVESESILISHYAYEIETAVGYFNLLSPLSEE